VSGECQVRASFCAPPPELARYFTSFYLAEIDVAEGGSVVDYLHPEWGNLRFASDTGLTGRNHRGDTVTNAAFVVSGPSAHALQFEVGTCRIWGFGLLPLGWAKFVGLPAAQGTDLLVDGRTHPDFAGFASLAQSLFAAQPDIEAEAAQIAAHFMELLVQAPPDDPRLQAIHAALVSPDVKTATDLAEAAHLGQRTLERLCHRAFGFAPKTLLRRQRFLRSLAQFMLDPAMNWCAAMDGHYHDQAQFIREFRQFMGMSPSEYAKLPHPVMDAFVAARMRAIGAAMQVLDGPKGAGAGSKT
jgi:AraC-like DNA-binding protein